MQLKRCFKKIINKYTTPNTDGSINKLVTVFADWLCSQDRFVMSDTATAPFQPTNIVYLDSLLIPRQFVPRHTSPQPTLNPDGKNTCHTLPAYRQAGLHRDERFLAKVPGPCPDAASDASVGAGSGNTLPWQSGPVKYGYCEGFALFHRAGSFAKTAHHHRSTWLLPKIAHWAIS